MNFPASVVSQFPSCTKSVTVRLDGTVIRLKQDREITVNGVELKELPAWINDAYVKKASSLFVMGNVNLAYPCHTWEVVVRTHRPGHRPTHELSLPLYAKLIPSVKA